MIRTYLLTTGRTYVVTYRLLGERRDRQLTGTYLRSDDEFHYFDCEGTQKISRDRVMRLQTPRP